MNGEKDKSKQLTSVGLIWWVEMVGRSELVKERSMRTHAGMVVAESDQVQSGTEHQSMQSRSWCCKRVGLTE